MELIEVSVSSIAVDREREHPVVLLKAGDSEDVLPIWIGPAEATAIYTVLSGKTFERPMTHDLLLLIVDELGAEVDSIEITGIHKDTYFARIILRRDGEVFYIDSRPSDSIATALRAGVPIYVDEALFRKYRRGLKIDTEGVDGAKRHFKDLDPGEFGDSDMRGDV